VTPAGIAVATEADVRLPLATAFARIVPIELPKIFPRYGPLPAVVDTRDQTGGWDHVGASRTVVLSDGTTASEEMTAYVEPSHFAYRLGGFSGQMRFLVDHAHGAWWFCEAGEDRTRIRWTYTFVPHPGRSLVLRAAVVPLWTRYQSRALALSVREAEKL
jgi:hypothetical protein